MNKSNLSPTVLRFLEDLESRIARLERANGDLLAENTLLRTQIADLEAKNIKLETQNTDLLSKVRLLETENKDLRAQLGKNSDNSDMPPSAEGYKKAPALPKASSGKRGGKPGHEGKTLMQVDKPDFVVVHHAVNCSCCGRLFGADDVEVVVEKRQVFDMPAPKLEVTEHQRGRITCCGKRQDGTFPEQVAAHVQYGTRVRALTVLLNTAFRMPFNKISELTESLFGQAVNSNTIVLSLEKVYERLEPVMEALLLLLLKSKVVHLDETGMRVEGSLHWFHTACNEFYSYIYVHKGRGKAAIESEESFMRHKFKNYVVHDCWKAYFQFKGCRHALCGAHILRELTALMETGSEWAKKMHQFLLQLYKASDKGTDIAPEIINGKRWTAEYDRICTIADQEEEPPTPTTKGKSKSSKGRNLLNRLVAHKAAVVAFATVKEVPFTNNCAEQNIRHVKVKQKVAMSFRTFHGAQIYARIQSFIATTRKLKQNTFNQLCNIINGHKYAFSNS